MDIQIECPRCGSELEIHDDMAICPDDECLHTEPYYDLDNEEDEW